MNSDQKLAQAYQLLALAKQCVGRYDWAPELVLLAEEEIVAFERGDDEIGHFINREIIQFCTDRMKILGQA